MGYRDLLLLFTFAWVALAATVAPSRTAKFNPCSTVLANPPPTDAACNIHGKLNKPLNGFIIDRFQLSNKRNDAFQQCAEICYNSEQCLSFSYNTRSSYCQLFNGTLEDHGYASPVQRDIPKYDIACFTTTCATPYCATPATATPTVSLAAPTPIFRARNGNQDDVYAPISLPFAAQLYGHFNSDIYISINGFITIAGEVGGFSNEPLPSSELGDTALAAFWDDLYIYARTRQGIFYDIQGVAPNRVAYVEYNVSSRIDSNATYHFIVGLPENQDNGITYTYYDVSDFGSSATVGAQSLRSNNSTQRSFDQQVIAPNLQLTFDVDRNKFITTNRGCTIGYRN